MPTPAEELMKNRTNKYSLRSTIGSLKTEIDQLKKNEIKSNNNSEGLRLKLKRVEEDNQILRKQLDTSTDQIKQHEIKIKETKIDVINKISLINKHEDQIK